MPPQRRNADQSTEYCVQQDRAGSRYNIGIELTSGQLRMAALATETVPNLDSNDAWRRTGFYAAASRSWQFAPQAGSVPAENIATVCAALAEFLDHLQIAVSNVDRIRIGGITTFDNYGNAVRVSTDSLHGRLAFEFSGADVEVGNRIREAQRVEKHHGAGVELRPSERLLYVRVSDGLNLDAPMQLTPDGIFARGLRHAEVNSSLLEQLGTDWLGPDYAPPPPRKCQICRQDYCLYGLASGQGILGLVGNDRSVVEVVAGAGGQVPIAEDRGARARVNNRDIDSAAVFRAARFDATCQRIVLQAGIALGLAVFEKVIQHGLFEPDLVVIGGTVLPGTVDEDQFRLGDRTTIDGMMQRTLAHLVREGLSQQLRITRSRFAGFTGLLGLTVRTDEAARA